MLPHIPLQGGEGTRGQVHGQGLDWTGLNGHAPCPGLLPEDMTAKESLEFCVKLSFPRVEIWFKSHTVKGQDTANKWYWPVMHMAQKSLKIIVRLYCMTFQEPQNQVTSLHYECQTILLQLQPVWWSWCLVFLWYQAGVSQSLYDLWSHFPLVLTSIFTLNYAYPKLLERCAGLHQSTWNIWFKWWILKSVFNAHYFSGPHLLWTRVLFICLFLWVVPETMNILHLLCVFKSTE